MNDNPVTLTCTILAIDEKELARQLGVSNQSLKHWKKITPKYVQLALAALIADLDVDRLLNGSAKFLPTSNTNKRRK